VALPIGLWMQLTPKIPPLPLMVTMLTLITICKTVHLSDATIWSQFNNQTLTNSGANTLTKCALVLFECGMLIKVNVQQYKYNHHGNCNIQYSNYQKVITFNSKTGVSNVSAPWRLKQLMIVLNAFSLMVICIGL